MKSVKLKSKLMVAWMLFSFVCGRRLEKEQKAGRIGWNDPYYKTEWQGRIRMLANKKLTQRRLINIANYCSFLWNLIETNKGEEKGKRKSMGYEMEWKLTISQPFPGFIKIILKRNEQVDCTNLLPKALFKEPHPILVEVLRREVVNLTTDNEEVRHRLLNSIISNVNRTIVGDIKLPTLTKENELRRRCKK